MKKTLAVILAVAMLAVCMTGCGIVKIIPKGEEAKYTGVEEFDASAEAAGDWANIQSEIVGKAADLAETLAADANGTTYCVSFTAKVEEHNTDSPKGYLRVSVEGVEEEVQVAVGSVFSGTTVRDSQTFKEYGDFTNQTEWSAYAKTVNAEVLTNVVEPLGDLSALVGATIEVVGCYTPGTGAVVVTPVSVTVQ